MDSGCHLLTLVCWLCPAETFVGPWLCPPCSLLQQAQQPADVHRDQLMSTGPEWPGGLGKGWGEGAAIGLARAGR